MLKKEELKKTLAELNDNKRKYARQKQYRKLSETNLAIHCAEFFLGFLKLQSEEL